MDPIPSLCELLEEKGIKVVEDDLPETNQWISVPRPPRWQSRSPLRSSFPAGSMSSAKRFTLAHELAHRIIRSTGNPAINAGDGD